MYLLTYILILTLEYVVCGEPKDTQLSLEVLCAIKKTKTSNSALQMYFWSLPTIFKITQKGLMLFQFWDSISAMSPNDLFDLKM